MIVICHSNLIGKLYMKVKGVEQSETYNRIHNLIYHFRKAARNECIKYNCRGVVDIEIIPEITLSFHMSGQEVYLRADKTTFLERIHNQGEMMGERDHLPIKVMSLYHKLESLVIRGEITLFDIEKTILGMI